MNFLSFLLLPLVGGYAFSTTWHGSLYHSTRESGHRLYFRAVFYAVFLLVASSLLHIIFFPFGWYQWCLAVGGSIVQPELIGSPRLWEQSSLQCVAVLAFVLGPVLGHILNIPNKLMDRKLGAISRLCTRWETNLLRSAIQNHDTERLLLRAVERNSPILITLKTGKVYAGVLTKTPNPKSQRETLQILPYASGYRDRDTHDLRFTTFYRELIEELVKGEGPKHLEPEDFEVVVPISEVTSLHLFDFEIYERFVGVQNDREKYQFPEIKWTNAHFFSPLASPAPEHRPEPE